MQTAIRKGDTRRLSINRKSRTSAVYLATLSRYVDNKTYMLIIAFLGFTLKQNEGYQTTPGQLNEEAGILWPSFQLSQPIPVPAYDFVTGVGGPVPEAYIVSCSWLREFRFVSRSLTCSSQCACLGRNWYRCRYVRSSPLAIALLHEICRKFNGFDSSEVQLRPLAAQQRAYLDFRRVKAVESATHLMQKSDVVLYIRSLSETFASSKYNYKIPHDLSKSRTSSSYR